VKGSEQSSHAEVIPEEEQTRRQKKRAERKSKRRLRCGDPDLVSTAFRGLAGRTAEGDES